MPADIAELINSYLPEGWSCTHVIGLGDDWQVICISDEFCAVSTGGSIEEALAGAGSKIEDGKFAGRLWDGIALQRSVEQELKIDLSKLFKRAPQKPERRI